MDKEEPKPTPSLHQKPKSGDQQTNECLRVDLLSRGCFPEVLRQSDMWWNGPPFLQATNDEIQETPAMQDNELPEMKESEVCNPAVNFADEPLFERCGTFSKLQRVLAQVVRFTRLVRMTKEERKNFQWIPVQDLRQAMKYIVRTLQKNELSEEIRCVQRKKLPRRLANLQPFLDEEGFLRVGGRLQIAFRRQTPNTSSTKPSSDGDVDPSISRGVTSSRAIRFTGRNTGSSMPDTFPVRAMPFWKLTRVLEIKPRPIPPLVPMNHSDGRWWIGQNKLHTLN